MSEDYQSLSQTGMKHYQKKEYSLAADYFSRAADLAHAEQQEFDEAEQRNNLSVALLFAGNAQQAYEAAFGTDQVFLAHKDIKRQAMALGNTAQALEELKEYPRALEFYDQAIELLKGENQGEIRSMLLRRKALLQAKTKDIYQGVATFDSSLDERPDHGVKEKFLQKAFDKLFMRKKA
jgi:tetratricopeptide (TPR) repeat protein